MPNRNGTGPEGKGPKTGRGMGSCASENSVQIGGRGRGLGAGRGFGRNVINDNKDQNKKN
jgi:hypothetical protein